MRKKVNFLKKLILDKSYFLHSVEIRQMERIEIFRLALYYNFMFKI